MSDDLENRIVDRRTYDSRSRLRMSFSDNRFVLNLVRVPDKQHNGRETYYYIDLETPWGEVYDFPKEYATESEGREAFEQVDLRFRQGYVPKINDWRVEGMVASEEFFRSDDT